MGKVSVGTGLVIKLLVPVAAVIIEEHMMRRNVKLIAGKPLKDGKLTPSLELNSCI